MFLLAGAGPAVAQQWSAVRLQPETAQFSNAYAVGAGQQGGDFRDSAGVSNPPVIWEGTSASWMSLAPGNGAVGSVYGIWHGVQVGYLSGRASLWTGTAASMIDLHPPGPIASTALGVRAGMQTGSVVFSGNSEHAALWRSSAATFVDLHPTGATRSYAFATDGTLQGGTAWFTSPIGEVPHALLWNGAAQGFVDLTPNGQPSDLYAMAPGVQVGDVCPQGVACHGAVWHGTAQSFTDLNASGGASRLFGTTGRIHTGDGVVGSAVGAAHAVVNFGRPDAWLDLHQFLPPGYSSFSAGNAVYQDGPTISIGGYAVSDATGQEQAFLWVGPDPCYPNCDQSTAPPALNVLDFVCFLNAFAAGDGYANCDGSTTPPALNILDFVCFINRFAAGCP